MLLAMAGNAVGLGNFLRFPAQAVEHGGGAFILPYLVSLLLLGVPLLWVEWTMGRYGGRFGHHSTPFMMDSMGRSRWWKYLGVFGIFTNVAIVAYYCYIESWTLHYLWQSLTNAFGGQSQAQVADHFGQYVGGAAGPGWLPVAFFVGCLVLNIWLLGRGLQGGVEKVAMIGMPLLILMAAGLAIYAFVLGDGAAPAGCTDCSTWVGMDFLWKPNLTGLWDFNTWLAAAGQIFFTLGVGMGTIHCYASYLRTHDDIALNALSAGWMNTFVEVVLGASIIIPLSVGFLGLDWVQQHAGFSMGFQTMPYLFSEMGWGGIPAGVAWFGLLFFAGITSSLAMGSPWVSFMEDEYRWPVVRSAWVFGGIVLIMGLPTVLFYHYGVLDEYDFWGGTVALVVFALAEIILFVRIFGLQRGWEELRLGADIRLPGIYKYIIGYVTPVFVLVVLLGSLITPKDNDWGRYLEGDFSVSDASIIGRLLHQDLPANRSYWATHTEAEAPARVVQVQGAGTDTLTLVLQDPKGAKPAYTVPLPAHQPLVKAGDPVEAGTPLATGPWRLNTIFYRDLSRLLLLLGFGSIVLLVYRANQKRKKR